MAKLTKKDVLHVAKLAKLTLTEKEIDQFTDQLSKVIDYVSELQKVDVGAVEPTGQTTGLINVFRKDEIDTGNYLTDEGPFEVEAILKERSDPTTQKLRGASK